MRLCLAGLSGLLAVLAAGGAARADEPRVEPLPRLVGHMENPLARVVNLGVFGNFNFEKGPEQRTQSACTLAALVPFDLPADWNLFVSGKLPWISQPVGANERTVGLGDMSLTVLVSPPMASGWAFGFGPSIVLPSASAATLGQGQWEIGPAIAVVRVRKTWVTGLAANQNWSVVGANTRPGVSRLNISPFVTWYINRGWYLVSAPTLSADWEQDPARVWTVPVGGGFGHIVRRGKHAFNFTAHAYVNVERPDGAAKWQARLTTSWVFPK